MSKFQGFSDSETFTPIPNNFFRHLLTEVDDLDELRVTLYALWRIANMPGGVHYLREQDFAEGFPVHPGASFPGKASLQGWKRRSNAAA